MHRVQTYHLRVVLDLENFFSVHPLLVTVVRIIFEWILACIVDAWPLPQIKKSVTAVNLEAVA